MNNQAFFEQHIIIPNDKALKQYKRMWNGDCLSSDKLTLFKCNGQQSLCCSPSEYKIHFDEIKAGEFLLERAFDRINESDESATLEAVLLLDAIYSTQLKRPYVTAHLFHEEIKHGLIQDIKEGDPETVVRRLSTIMKNTEVEIEDKERVSIYSFSTKFCNRICPKNYPIFDSYVAWLLNYYLNKANNTQEKTSRFGNYGNFINAYGVFKKKYSLSFETYKDIDVFMWTYGKALNKFAEKWNKTHSKDKIRFKAEDIDYKLI